ncbi:hypothetical protein AWM61_07045 [Riemerella anatipestifer]|uniref:DUF6037 family protein n=1 Tax=Riemerella anatipestifer TaxID=34085 RepID=UPI0007EDEB6F|nr:DUF6037 family protein [Riemerella anatipestifer]OBP55051.1 hypothetical protein AWM61_07045 [Riemerella anatipestifer]
MFLSNLKELYKRLKEQDETYYLFHFTKNSVRFEVLFDIFHLPFQLHFLQKESDFSFCIIIRKGFIINDFLDRQTYKNLCKILNLKFDKDNPFSTKLFFEEFNLKIPSYQVKEKKERELLVFYQNDIEESEKLYFDGVIEWNKIKNGKGVTIKNLEKTRILYPELYHWCKRENISLRYTHIKKDKENLLIDRIKKDIA